MSFREMRRSDRALTRQQALELLERGIYGTLSTVGEDGWPAGTPLSYALEGDFLYFHCALEGQKLDHMRHQPRVCFSVVGQVQAVYRTDFTTTFESAVAHGTASEIADEAEKIHALRLLCEKYLPGHMEQFDRAVQKSLKATGVWKIHIDHLTGKAKR